MILSYYQKNNEESGVKKLLAILLALLMMATLFGCGLKLEALQPGTYTCKYRCQVVTGESFAVREFTFIVE